MSIIYFIIILSICVIVHELGHLLAAKAFNVYCSEFAIGMGPKLFSKKFKETTYTIRALPLGGFVAMAGDNENALESKVDEEVDESRTLKGIKPWKKIIIMLAGVTMNFILALILISGILLYNGGYALPSEAVVAGVVENSPASAAGLLENDIILQVKLDDGRVINPKTFDDILVFTSTYEGVIEYTIQRDSEELVFSITPELADDGYYKAGILIPQPEVVEINLLNAPYYATDFLWTNTKAILTSLSHLVTGKGLEQLSGPIGVYQMTDEVVSLGFSSVLIFIAMLSLNLGIFNLLPLPILDGGRVVLTFIEIIMGKPLNKKIETAIMSVSMLLMLLLFVVVMFNDIMKLW